MQSIYRFGAIAGTILGLLLCHSLKAQQPLSLAEAIAIGLENNYGIQIADMRVRVAETNDTWGNVGALPRLDLNLNGRYFQSGNPASFLRSNQNLSAGLSFNWTVFDGMAMFANKSRLELLEEQSRGNAAVVVENAIQAIMLAYYDALIADEARRVLSEILENSKERLAFEEYRLELGTSSTFDVLQFRNAVVTDSANLVSQELSLINSFRVLNQLMNTPITDLYSLTDTLSEEFGAYELADLQSAMTENNNNLHNQFINQQLREQEIRAAQALRLPSLSLNAGTNYTLGQAGLIDGTSRNVAAGDFSVGFTLSFNLFNGFNTTRQIEVARLNERITELETRDLERSLQNELYVVYDNYVARRKLLLLQNENVENTQLNLDLADDRFKRGLLNSFDYRQVQAQYLNAQLDRLRALRNINASEAELIRLTGGLIREG